jgi:tRNA dimethylallyltransferase
MSIGRSPRASRRRLRSPDVVAAGEGNVDRDFVEQPLRRPGEGRMARAPSTIVLSSAGLAGLQMSVATRDMQANSQARTSKAVLIAGPTASGKSALALELAQKTGGVVINADSMQVYRDLRIITARPTPEEEAQVPHRLYGHVDAAVNFSAGAWVADAAKCWRRRARKTPADLRRRLRAVFQGADARAVGGAADSGRDARRVRARLERDGVEALHAELARRDPARPNA